MLNIKWESTGQLLERDSEERERTYVLEGVGNDGRVYAAIGIYVCGELEKIEDISDVTPSVQSPVNNMKDDKLKDHVSLLVIQSGRRTLITDLLKWVSEWCDGLYEDVVIRNTFNGNYEILGKLTKQFDHP